MFRFLYVSAMLSLMATIAAAAPKNIVFLVADDLGRQVGCYGDAVAKTPNIDALAASGTRFVNAFASVSSCSPSRATMLTGVPTHTNGQYGLAHGTHNSHSFRNVKGLPALLASAGYRSGVVAKLHVQPKEVYPFDAEIADAGRNPVSVAEKARKFIQDAAGKPFFLHIGYTDPHRTAKGFGNDNKYPATVPNAKFDPAKLPVPYHLPDVPEVREELAEYYQSVARMDHGIGLMMKVLEETKTLEDTLIVFLSDNGIPFPGAKTTLYDAGIHLPLIIKKPGQKAGVVSDAMVSFTDLVPTALDWAGIAKSTILPGRSLLPILEQPKPEGWDEVYASHQFHEVTMYYPMRVVRTRTHKLILNLAHELEYPSASDLWESPTWQGVLKRNDAMMGQRPTKDFLHRPKVELYDIVADRNELKNRADEPGMKAIHDELLKKLTAWRSKTNDPWLPEKKFPHSWKVSTSAGTRICNRT